MTLKYDPRLTTFIVNGRHITYWLSLEGGRENDRVTGQDTADGQVYFGINPSCRGHYSLVLPTVNPHTAFLDNLSNSDEEFPVVCIDRSGSARSSRAASCMVKKVADQTRRSGEEKTEEAWDFVAADYTVGYQGDVADDVAIQPTG